jgi:hypothetical protein
MAVPSLIGKPCYSVQMGDKALETMRLRANGVEMALGGSDGSVSVVRLSASLVESQPNERATVQAVSRSPAKKLGDLMQSEALYQGMWPQ